MQRISSSSSTFYYKRVFPVIWFGGLAVLAFLVFFSNNSADAPPLPFFIFPVGMAVFGYFLMKKLVFDLADEVTDAGGFLLVRFGKIQEQIALTNITNVSYTLMMNPSRATLPLRQPCRFGKEVSFSPLISWVPFSKSPVIAGLIERIDASRKVHYSADPAPPGTKREPMP